MANPTNAKNTAPVSKNNAAPVDEQDFSKWTERQVSFAPYWSPSAGGSFFGRIIAVDDRNPEFVRLQFQCLQEKLMCHRGPVEGGEDVVVTKGETFSMSVYSALADELMFQLQSGISPPTKIMCTKKTKTLKGNDVWNFRCLVAPEDDKLLKAAYPEWQKARANQLGGGAATRPALES